MGWCPLPPIISPFVLVSMPSWCTHRIPLQAKTVPEPRARMTRDYSDLMKGLWDKKDAALDVGLMDSVLLTTIDEVVLRTCILVVISRYPQVLIPWLSCFKPRQGRGRKT
ncbi:hypothetical protein BDZ94DRAFT_1253769 [Collybia nuda]|uniref:Uncharacterized protein n=1 Tax=Collybia nuda TaxID=64659 RepID=A0A9P6CGT0_9AGAR|nr:hypothetical protein BDZ94DRAFT_1253769 [Collybia nuda]